MTLSGLSGLSGLGGITSGSADLRGIDNGAKIEGSSATLTTNETGKPGVEITKLALTRNVVLAREGLTHYNKQFPNDKLP